MPILETITLSVPQHWITPIVYGDTEGLDECEAGAFERWYQDMTRDVGHGKPIAVGAVNEEPYFARYHDAAEYGVPACNCHDVDFLVEAVRHEPNKGGN